MSSIQEVQQELIEEFSFFDHWMDRYQYIIDMGRRLPEFPDALRTEENKLHGCQSQVWLATHADGDRLEFQAISDSAIVSGLIAILMRIFSGQPAVEILAAPLDFVSARLSPGFGNAG